MSDEECEFECSGSAYYDAEEDVEEDVYSAAVVEADRSELRVVREYSVLSPGDLLEEQQQEVSKVSQVCGLANPSWARILLRKYQWNVEVLLTDFFDKGIERVLRDCGIDAGENRTLDAEVECQACYDTVEPAMAYAPSCGHAFCTDCWTQHISIKVREGQAKRIGCMGHKCPILLDDAVIVNFVTPDIREKFTKQLVESYVNDNANVRWCPSAPHCGNCVRLTTAVGKCFDIHCNCGVSWCFQCYEVPHSPATCAMHKKWQAKAKDDSETCNWLKSNTKDCPHCKNAIEKDGGCNFVHCTQCNREFCWMCMFLCPAGQSHTAHDCNKYTGNDKAGKGDDTSTARESLQRYMHYYDRWKAHSDSYKFAAIVRDRLAEKVSAMQDRLDGSQVGYEVQWLIEGVEKLFQCRHILKNSYVFAFFMFEQTSGAASEVIPISLTKREQERLQRLFEDHQQQLENTTETLNALLDQPVDTFLYDRHATKRVQEFTTLAENRLQGLYDVVHSDILKGDCGIIAPYHKAKPSPYHENLKPEEVAELRRQAKKSGQKHSGTPPAAPPIQPYVPQAVLPAPTPALPKRPREEDSELQEAIRRSQEEMDDHDLHMALAVSLAEEGLSEEDAMLQRALLASRSVQ